MIYKSSYFGKELRQAYIENRISTKRKVAFALFLGLLSFAVHFVLQTLTESVLSDAVPEMMQQSYFSTVFVYICIALFMNVMYFLFYYDYLFFAEIRKNRWYLLVKMAYKPVSMIFSKLCALTFSLITVYTVGFFMTLALTVFLKYSFIYQYLPALYLAGLINLILISMISIAGSLYIKHGTNARYFIFFSAVFVVVLEVVTGYYGLISNRILMQDLSNLFDFSITPFLPIAAAIVLVCVAICFLRARFVAKYYSVFNGSRGYVLPEDAKVVRVDDAGKVRELDNRNRERLRGKIVDAVVTMFLVIFIFAALAFNVFIILISTSQPGKEVTIRGVIPYIFKSDTMEPEIMVNDLAYFRRINEAEEVNVGDIVLFKQESVVYVERVKSKSDGRFEVDIDYYPPMSQPDSMKKTVDRAQIYGLYIRSDRWLGALILFANTIFGRLVFLLVPAFLLFFYKPIKNLYNKGIKTLMEE
jgi:hypothetical protein